MNRVKNCLERKKMNNENKRIILKQIQFVLLLLLSVILFYYIWNTPFSINEKLVREGSFLIVVALIIWLNYLIHKCYLINNEVNV